jgi:hypothetical protein
VCEVKTKGFIKPLALGWIGGQREKVREVYGSSSLVKQNKKGKNCAVFCFAGKRKLLYLYLRCDYMGKKKSSANHYYCQYQCAEPLARWRQHL